MKIILLFLLLFAQVAHGALLGGGGLLAPPAGIPLDTAAAAFLTAIGNTDPAVQKAINDYVIDAKEGGFWDTDMAVYPCVGGTAAAHKYNLKNPLDTDGAYRLTFSGSWTHASTGMKPAALTAYADTHLVPSVALNQNHHHLSFFIRTNTGVETDRYNIGAFDGGANKGLGIALYNSSLLYIFLNNAGGSQGSSPALVTTGFWLLTRTASNAWAFFKPDGTKLSSGTTAAATSTTIPLYVGSLNFNGGRSATGMENTYFSIGNGQSDALVALRRTAVLRMMTTLGR